jgi:hypothetical protein
MGYGAYMTVINNRTEAIHLYITDVQCMYDDGHDGSELSLFNDAVLQPNTKLPNNDKGQYIEAKASGTCFFDNSQFTVKIEDDSNSAIIGHVAFDDNSEDWKYTNDNEDVIDVYVNNSGDQAIINITVEAS